MFQVNNSNSGGRNHKSSANFQNRLQFSPLNLWTITIKIRAGHKRKNQKMVFFGSIAPRGDEMQMFRHS